jgi:hypothetical protein
MCTEWERRKRSARREPLFRVCATPRISSACSPEPARGAHRGDDGGARTAHALPGKTRVTRIDEEFEFVGWRIHRNRASKDGSTYT